MRLLVYEHVTGGGMLAESPPASLVREADMMMRALLAELGALPGLELLATRDPRLPPLPGVTTLAPVPGEAPADLYRRGLLQADAAWPTAPETGGILLALAVQTLDSGRQLIGCRPEAIRVASSKRRTAAALASAGIAVIPTFLTGQALPTGDGPWAVKPDDGAGATGTWYEPGREAALTRLEGTTGHVAQPWVEGEAASLSLLVGTGGIRLLACNRQRIAITAGRVTLRSLEVNAIADADGALAALARRIAGAIPGLQGYVGVDLIRTPVGPVVVEVNPRLTTSYAGLGEALGVNVAALVLAAAAGAAPAPLPWRAGRAVTLAFGPVDA